MSRPRILLPLIIFVVSGCGAGRDVHGSKRILRVAESGFEQFEDLDLTVEQFQTLVDKGGGSYESSPGDPSIYGYFIVRDVTEEDYLLVEKVGDRQRIFVSNSDDIDLSRVSLGRAYLAYPRAESDLRLNLTNLAPWNDDDDLELVAPNIDGLVDLVREAKTGTPAVGAEEVANLTIDFNDRALPLLDLTKQDHFWVSQLEHQTGDAVDYLALTRSVAVAPVTMTEGQNTDASAPLVEVPQNGSFDTQIRGSAFLELTSAVHPNATLIGGTVEVLSLLSAKKHGYHSDAPRLAATYYLGGGTDFRFNVHYGDPYPDNWDDLVSVAYVYNVEVTALTAARTATIGFDIGGTIPLEEARSAGSLEPRLTPVRNVKLDGAAIGVRLEHVGTAPLLSWDPPARGNANAYRLVVYALNPQENGDTLVSQYLEIYTNQTEFQFPTGAISGATFHVLITAYDDPARDPVRAVYREQVPSWHASMLTGAFLP